MKKMWLGLCGVVLVLVGCAEMAVWMTEKKSAQISSSHEARLAKQFFWETLHHHRVADMERAEKMLMQAYLKHTQDPVLAAYIAFIHIWKLTERDFSNPSPLVVNEIHLAQDYFTQALNLDYKNPIYLGFLGDTYLVKGQVFQDKRAEVKGYFMLKEAIAQWPAFNYFTAGYPMSTLSADSKHFKEALDWQWQTLDVCAGQKVNRQNPSFAPYMSRQTTKGPMQACWNTWIAPHNFEGFFMNMGDMLVKSGDWHTAILIYKNARLSQTYLQWPYRKKLENRILNAKRNVRDFNQNYPGTERAVMLNSGFGCMACHQV